MILVSIVKRGSLNMVGGEVEGEGEGGGAGKRRERWRGRRALPANQGLKGFEVEIRERR